MTKKKVASNGFHLSPTVNKFEDGNFAENEKLFVVGVAGCDGGGGRGGGNQRSSQVLLWKTLKMV